MVTTLRMSLKVHSQRSSRIKTRLYWLTKKIKLHLGPNGKYELKSGTNIPPQFRLKKRLHCIQLSLTTFQDQS
jgi:hypothetical protein